MDLSLQLVHDAVTMSPEDALKKDDDAKDDEAVDGKKLWTSPKTILYLHEEQHLASSITQALHVLFLFNCKLNHLKHRMHRSLSIDCWNMCHVLLICHVITAAKFVIDKLSFFTVGFSLFILCHFLFIFLRNKSLFLKPVDTIGKCHRPVFSLAVSQHMHKIKNMWKFELDWSS